MSFSASWLRDTKFACGYALIAPCQSGPILCMASVIGLEANINTSTRTVSPIERTFPSGPVERPANADSTPEPWRSRRSLSLQR
jgi:hypothetical protein